jgi:hypothetical protein
MYLANDVYFAAHEVAEQRLQRNRRIEARMPVRELVGRIWKRVCHVPGRLVRWSQRSRDERLVAEARARFWAEVRAGEREAEARTRP